MNMMERTATDLYEQQAELLKSLTHPTRLAILDLLRDGEACVCHLEAALGLRQSYISQQIAVLREAGLVQDRRDGWNIYYQVTNPKIYDLVDMAEQILYPSGFYRNRLKTANCPCPKCSSLRAE
jgi:DNA-binding transcriptional ArsR family regulator